MQHKITDSNYNVHETVIIGTVETGYAKKSEGKVELIPPINGNAFTMEMLALRTLGCLFTYMSACIFVSYMTHMPRSTGMHRQTYASSMRKQYSYVHAIYM
ncbi:hypothetical protein L6164_006364 [Bauhinia variegata]|uniref:Uncharacterized protein n=1 Tax=Bauhinia variegata TaxID=167791 RepID=A0ACB9PTQ0_BAUVA|nr:hypothetical protein L6164_006364 [Bauhinia variegata]